MIIEIPNYRPSAIIGGNRRGHGASLAAAIRVAREVGWAYGLQSMHDPDLLEGVPVSGRLAVCYTVRGRSRMDGDNMITALKPVLDGLADAGVLADDRQIREWRLLIEEADEDVVTIEIRQMEATR